MKLRLVNVACASLEELLLDYEDYLRVRDHPKWAKNSKEALYVRKLGRTPDESYETYRQFMDTRPPQVLANIALCLIHQANYLLDQQRRRLEKDFVKKRRHQRAHDCSAPCVSQKPAVSASESTPRQPTAHQSTKALKFNIQ